MIRTLQIQDREISDANSYFVAKHGVITHSSGFWGNLTSITLKLIIDNIGIDYQGGCSHQNACQPKDLGRDRRPCGLTIYFRPISKFLAINSKKNGQLMYQWNIFQNIWNIFQNIWNIFENSANIFPPGLHLPLLCWHKYHPRGNGGNLTMKATFIHNLDHTHNKLQIGWFLCNMG